MRTKKYDNSCEQYIKLTSPLMKSNAWVQLSVAAKALYPLLKFEWKGPRANNNGQISLSVRQAAALLNVSNQTAAKAFYDLQEKGFIFVTEIGHPGVYGSASCNRFELTELPLPGSIRGRRLYLNWKAGCDFDVKKAQANNPKGTNGKKKIPA